MTAIPADPGQPASLTTAPSSLIEAVTAIVRQVLGPTGAGVTADGVAADTPRWDSGAMVAMVLEIEERYGFEMTSPELESLAGVADLVRVTAAHLRGRRPG